MSDGFNDAYDNRPAADYTQFKTNAEYQKYQQDYAYEKARQNSQ